MPKADPTSPGCQAVLQLAGDLEQCLKAMTPDKRDHRGLKKHIDKFPNAAELAEARIIRNCIAHRDPITDAQVQRAEAAFVAAVDDIMPYCPEALQQRLRMGRGEGGHHPAGS